jgi:hypothetical protein
MKYALGSFGSKNCVPGEGIHAHGPFGFAVFDAVLTVLAGWLISTLFKVNIWATLLVLFLLGIAVHRILGVNTALNKLIFGKV